MTHSKKNARERILQAAIESFQSLGYARTTTQAIATKAGVAEVTIFRHFGDKQSLFQVIVQKIGGGPAVDELEALLTDDLEADLRFMSQHILSFFVTQQDAIRMLMFEADHFPEMGDALAQNPQTMLEVLGRYFQKQIQAGRMRPVNVEATAQVFVSTLFGYAIGVGPITNLLPQAVAMAEVLEEFVQIFMSGIINQQ